MSASGGERAQRAWAARVRGGGGCANSKFIKHSWVLPVLDAQLVHTA